MGHISAGRVLTSLLVLIVYSAFFYGVNASDIPSSGDANQIQNEFTNKRPAVWLKTLPPLRRLKPLSAYSVYRRDMQPSDIEFADDSIGNIEKKFDDYGHLRFGKRGGGEGDGFDDYGHMR